MELFVHIAEVVYVLAAFGFLGSYFQTEDATYLLASALCALSAGLSFLLSWPWFLAVGGIAAAGLLLVSAGGRRQ